MSSAAPYHKKNMNDIKVDLGSRSYNIAVASHRLGKFARLLKGLGIGSDPVIITVPKLKRVYGSVLESALAGSGFNPRFELVADSETSKSAQSAFRVINRIAAYDRLKKVFIVAFGGGVTGDLAGFVASVYKRGIPYVQLPTTLLAQVDSSIGGKVAIDLPAGKNLVGSFYQPRLVFSDTAFLKTLPPRQIRCGLAEIIKYGVIRDSSLFSFLEDNLSRILMLDKAALKYIITKCSGIKARVVSADEFDNKGLRVMLNYGHTIGHAIEAACGYSSGYNHGEAIALGMIAANHIARDMGLLSGEGAGRIHGLIKRCGLPTKAKGISLNAVYKLHMSDKKFIHKKNRFVLPKRIGAVITVENVPSKPVKGAIRSIL
ncbi:MAG: 3-dehydroquinate synthase [Candidatus Omnitrophota bacterium]